MEQRPCPTLYGPREAAGHSAAPAANRRPRWRRGAWGAFPLLLVSLAGRPAAANPARSLPLHLPSAVLLRADQPNTDPDLKGYANLLGAVGLACRTLPAGQLRGLVVEGQPQVLIVPAATARRFGPAQVREVVRRVESGAILVSEEVTPLARALGFTAGRALSVREVRDTAHRAVPMLWENARRLQPLRGPAGSLSLMEDAREHRTLVSLARRGKGRCLLLAAPLDSQKGEGFRLFPYFLEHLQRAGVTYPFRAERLSALFDYGYRCNANLPRLAQYWRQMGVQVLHVGGWAFHEPDAGRWDYLRRLIAACHQNGILVYLWLEWPHVSDEFWNRHPEWREKTGTGKDAHLDWRYLMNLKDPACFKAATAGLTHLIERFDWDGVNVSELYFESPMGPAQPEEMTPLNALVRAEFKARSGFDPMECFQSASPHFWKKDKAGWAKFVEYRVDLELALNEQMLVFLTDLRGRLKRDLGIILLYIDNLYDASMREGVAADVRRLLPLQRRYDFGLIIEDPYTLWSLGPERYSVLSQRYAPLAPRPDRLGIDINVVDRDPGTYPRVFPTRKQTGGELALLFSHAARGFRTVMVYSEQSLYPWDAELIPHALAHAVTGKADAGGIAVTAKEATVLRAALPGAVSRPAPGRAGTTGAPAFLVDGKLSPCVSGRDVLLPAGTHRVTVVRAAGSPRPRLVRLNGELKEARYSGERAIEFAYSAEPRGIALFDAVPKSVRIDGTVRSTPKQKWLMLPGGEHRVVARF